MVRVHSHGNKIAVVNPVTGQETVMINVTFVEEGRGGANSQLALTSDFLSQITGESVGLSQIRVHTQPVVAEKISLFPIGKEFPGHVNRALYSTPQMEQQKNAEPRMIDGQPTYFTTWISNREEEDVDKRISNEALLQLNPQGFLNISPRATVVKVLEEKPSAAFRTSETVREPVPQA